MKPGEVLGIIGKNGAGKSTLLKILSRITNPTKGGAVMRGRVASLLEVGTGFHPELTGRENIYLNGALLGMSRLEIDRKFDEIVAFSEIEKFLDTPVKFYSSGMYVRLAFSVAAHLEPEILIVDEVLAVGDASFQQKSLGKMSDVTTDGRTILFVSHNMAAIQSLCTRAICLESGYLKIVGNPSEVVEAYRETISGKTRKSLKLNKRTAKSRLLVTDILLRDSKGKEVTRFKAGEDVKIEIVYKLFDRDLKNINCSLGLDTFANQQRIAHLSNKTIGTKLSTTNTDNRVSFFIKKLPLNQGKYLLTIFTDDTKGEILDWVRNAIYFEVVPGKFYGSNKLPSINQGSMLLDYKVF